MDKPRYKLRRKVPFKTISSVGFEGRYYDDSRVVIFLTSKRVDSLALDQLSALPN